MNLHLPARHDGTRETVNAGKRRVVIIGANGLRKEPLCRVPHIGDGGEGVPHLGA